MKLDDGTKGIVVTEYPFYDLRFIPLYVIRAIDKVFRSKVFLSDGINPELDEIRAMETYEEIQEMMNEP
jgi:hypothetical protein